MNFNDFFQERITDISNDLCIFVDDANKKISTTDLVRLYDYHNNNHHIHPLTNWHAHRIRCMSSIAVRLKDKVKIWECHYHILNYYHKLSRCSCHCTKSPIGTNHDFYHRNSLNYLVYGSQALINACLYIFPYTKYNYYKDIIEPIIIFLTPYLNNKKTHIEYVKSDIVSDKSRPEYGKKWDPDYAKPFLRLVEELKQQKINIVNF